jgi:transcriptional regulator with XRE-family HTH domain
VQPEELKAARKAGKMTQHQLAEAIGLSPGYIGEMERGEKPIEKHTAIAVRCVLEHGGHD